MICFNKASLEIVIFSLKQMVQAERVAGSRLGEFCCLSPRSSLEYPPRNDNIFPGFQPRLFTKDHQQNTQHQIMESFPEKKTNIFIYIYNSSCKRERSWYLGGEDSEVFRKVYSKDWGNDSQCDVCRFNKRVATQATTHHLHAQKINIAAPAKK